MDHYRYSIVYSNNEQVKCIAGLATYVAICRLNKVKGLTYDSILHSQFYIWITKINLNSIPFTFIVSSDVKLLSVDLPIQRVLWTIGKLVHLVQSVISFCFILSGFLISFSAKLAAKPAKTIHASFKLDH